MSRMFEDAIRDYGTSFRCVNTCEEIIKHIKDYHANMRNRHRDDGARSTKRQGDRDRSGAVGVNDQQPEEDIISASKVNVKPQPGSPES